ncbi:Odorant receptor PhOr5 [Pediculus humanus corporis]|uniref:Odorant receptor n=1 Tax=Pediculus humanus subsp. corporis TaxID=121224 RepID=E0VMU0_PEDHC|nr:Odorant receptor PhOr5 [Pediculus humanus corporis]EEB14696.1 Odorant receptor PhOr5 [Pediculus humanus corporis]
MEKNFENHVYSINFNALRKLGLWNWETKNNYKKKLFLFYRCFAFLFSVTALMAAIIQLYISRHDFRKVSFNLCTTLLSSGILLKNFYLGLRSVEIDGLRHDLYEDEMKQNDYEEIKIIKNYQIKFIIFRKFFYTSAFGFLSIWLIVSLLTLKWGPRELPFSIWLPLNIENNKEFFIAFIVHAIRGSYVVADAINSELSMFGLLLQIKTQYKILVNKLYKLSRDYSKFWIREKINKYKRILIENEYRSELKICIKRQLELDDYLRKLEIFYHKPMLLQLGICLSLAVVSGVKVLGSSFNLKWFYMIGYTLMVTFDLFVLCFMVDFLFEERKKLAHAFYDVHWYEMECYTQKDLIIIIKNARIEKSLTAWKIFTLDLKTFLGVLKALGSWLALFWQIMREKNNN